MICEVRSLGPCHPLFMLDSLEADRDGVWGGGVSWGLTPIKGRKRYSELQCRFGKALATLPGENVALGVLHELASFNQLPDACYLPSERCDLE